MTIGITTQFAENVEISVLRLLINLSKATLEDLWIGYPQIYVQDGLYGMSLRMPLP